MKTLVTTLMLLMLSNHVVAMDVSKAKQIILDNEEIIYGDSKYISFIGDCFLNYKEGSHIKTVMLNFPIKHFEFRDEEALDSSLKIFSSDEMKTKLTVEFAIPGAVIVGNRGDSDGPRSYGSYETDLSQTDRDGLKLSKESIENKKQAWISIINNCQKK